WVNTRAEIERLAARHGFLHWHLAFPDVFRLPAPGQEPGNPEAGWTGGFDVVLGNPPWERVKLQEKEWFATRRPDIAGAPNAAARKRLIDALAVDDPALHAAFLDARREAEGESHFVRSSGRYPLCGRGDINTYSIFAETMRLIVGRTGRVGCIVPTGIATDDTTKAFFGDLVESRRLVSLHGFENEERIFPAVHHATKFCLLTIAGLGRPQAAADFVFFARQVVDLRDEHRHFSLTPDDIALLNPNTRTCPIFRSRRDAELTKAIYRRVPVLMREGPPEENPWGIRFLAMLHMANDSGLFRTREQLEADGWALDGNVFRRGDETCLPLYEAKMVHHFDHRFGTYEGQTEAQANQGKLPELDDAQHADPDRRVLPRYWVPEPEVLVRAAAAPEALREAYAARREDLAAEALADWLEAEHARRGERDATVAALHRRFARRPAPASARPTRGRPRAPRARPAAPVEHALTNAELLLVRDSPDALTAAHRLLDARCPRWFRGWRDICRATDQRTVIASLVPRAAIGHTTPLMLLGADVRPLAACLLANLTTFVLDYSARQKVGGTHLTYAYLNQLPVLD